MIIDKLFKNADDHSKNLQERVFSVIPIIGLLALFMLIFIGILVGDNIVNSFVMVQQMHCGDEELAGDIVIMTSAVSILSFFLWILIFKSAGVF